MVLEVHGQIGARDAEYGGIKPAKITRPQVHDVASGFAVHPALQHQGSGGQKARSEGRLNVEDDIGGFLHAGTRFGEAAGLRSGLRM